MWDSIAELRTLSGILQWVSIGLVFISGFLQVGKFIVDRREKVLSNIEQAERLSPLAQPIQTAGAVIEIVQVSKDAVDAHYMDSGAALAFAKGDQALMVLRSLDSFAVQNGKGEIVWRATLVLDLADVSVGKPVRSLRDSDFLEFLFGQLKEGAVIRDGSVAVTINSAVRLQAKIPSQVASKDGRLFLRDLTEFSVPLKK
jgi:hypothetical protein